MCVWCYKATKADLFLHRYNIFFKGEARGKKYVGCFEVEQLSSKETAAGSRGLLCLRVENETYSKYFYFISVFFACGSSEFRLILNKSILVVL